MEMGKAAQEGEDKGRRPVPLQYLATWGMQEVLPWGPHSQVGTQTWSTVNLQETLHVPTAYRASPDSIGSHPEMIHVGLERGKGLEFKPQLLLRLKKKKSGKWTEEHHLKWS
jgi:hypothetical protein